MGRKKIGELLVDAGLIDEDDLRRALKEQAQWGGALGQIMVELELVKELDLVFVLSRQLHIPVAELEDREIPKDVLDMVPLSFCQTHKLIPFNKETVGNFLDVAMVEPLNLDTLDNLRVLTKSNIRSNFTTYSTLNRLLRKYFGVPLKRRATDSARGRQSISPSLHLDGRELTAEDFEPNTPTTSDYSETKKTSGSKEQVSRSPSSISSENPPVSPIERKLTDFKAQLISAREETKIMETRIETLEDLIERDEIILRRLLGFLVEKELCTKEELKQILSG